MTRLDSSSESSENRRATDAADGSGEGLGLGSASSSGIVCSSAAAVVDSIDDYEKRLEEFGFEIRHMIGDGNCLFRAVAEEVYGDQEMHGVVRRQCCDMLEKDEEHVKNFVTTKSFKDYVQAMRKDGCFGSHVEIQAMSDIFCRPIEVYQPQAPGEPIRPLNIFQSTSVKSSAPIRLLYLLHNHYEALIDPQHPSVGVGLGIKGLEQAPKESVEAKNVQTVMKESEREQLDKALMESVMDRSADAQLLHQAIKDSESEELEKEMEQQAIQQSILDYMVQLSSRIVVPQPKRHNPHD